MAGRKSPLDGLIAPVTKKSPLDILKMKSKDTSVTVSPFDDHGTTPTKNLRQEEQSCELPFI